MSDTLKPMTEKELRIMLANIAPFPEVAKNIDLIICRAKDSGYIIKSSLQQKVEEAEEMLREFNTSAWDMNYYERHFNCIQYFTPKVKQLEETIQALKVDHPEFKK